MPSLVALLAYSYLRPQLSLITKVFSRRRVMSHYRWSLLAYLAIHLASSGIFLSGALVSSTGSPSSLSLVSGAVAVACILAATITTGSLTISSSFAHSSIAVTCDGFHFGSRRRPDAV